MMTGRSPAKHGVLDFFEPGSGPARHAFISSGLIEGEALWDTVSRHGQTVGIVNVPLTYPPVAVNGYMVSGFMTPKGREDYTYPADLRQEILAVTGQYDPDPWDLLEPAQDLEQFKRWMDIAEQAAEHLYLQHAVDFYVSVIQGIDQLQHIFWDMLMDSVRGQRAVEDGVWRSVEACYARMDQAIGRRMQWLAEDSFLFITSDHGFQSVNTWLHLNHWLAEHGYLTFAKAQASLGQSLMASRGWTREDMKRLVRSFDRLGLRRLLGRFARASIADRIDDLLSVPIDWSHTVAYSGSRTSEGIYINLKGREPQGIVEPGAEYESIRERIIAELSSLGDPATGRSALSAVYRREDLYSGKHLARMPDILLGLDDRPYLISESTAAKHTFEPISARDIKGRHHSRGTFAAVGRHVVRGLELEAEIVDVAPTILYAMGLPIPADTDGRVLEEIFTPEFRRSHPVQHEAPTDLYARQAESPTYTAEEEEAMLRRLQDLGYLS
jgi:predicted AlkP superfamily phosphohydrolase/phosphomutase